MNQARAEDRQGPGDLSNIFVRADSGALVPLASLISLSDAAGRSRVTPSVIVALSGVRHRYDDLMETAANGPAATLGQRLYISRGRAKLSTKEAANGVGLRKDLIEAVEAEEPPPRKRRPASRV